VGAKNFFLFGLTADEVARRKRDGYRPWEIRQENPELREAIDMIRDGFFSGGDPDVFRPLADALVFHDHYMLFADYAAYVECQNRVAMTFRDAAAWTRMSILNVARIGTFSSDRAVREYCEDIWKVKPVPVPFHEEVSLANGGDACLVPPY
jgi:starch phosphorylase